MEAATSSSMKSLRQLSHTGAVLPRGGYNCVGLRDHPVLNVAEIVVNIHGRQRASNRYVLVDERTWGSMRTLDSIPSSVHG